MKTTHYKHHTRSTLGQILLCCALARICQGQEKTVPLASQFSKWEVARWEGDCKLLDLSQVATEPKERWGIFSFTPDFPGQTIIEERAAKDPKTGVWQVLSGTDTKPLVKGKYSVVEQLGVGVNIPSGSYRYEATPGLTGFISGPIGQQNYLKGEPRFIGGYAIARLNDTQDSTQFVAVSSLPPQWLPYIKPIVQEYRDSTVSVQKQLVNPSWILDRLKSPNPVWRIISLQNLLQRQRLSDIQLEAIQNQFILEKGFERAVFARFLIDSDRETGRFHTLLSKEVLQSLNQASAQDVSFLLNTLLAAEVLRTHNPITGKEDISFGPSLLRVLSVKIATTDQTNPLASENTNLLKSFILGPVKVDFPPVPEN